MREMKPKKEILKKGIFEVFEIVTAPIKELER